MTKRQDKLIYIFLLITPGSDERVGFLTIALYACTYLRNYYFKKELNSIMKEEMFHWGCPLSLSVYVFVPSANTHTNLYLLVSLTDIHPSCQKCLPG